MLNQNQKMDIVNIADIGCLEQGGMKRNHGNKRRTTFYGRR